MLKHRNVVAAFVAGGVLAVSAAYVTRTALSYAHSRPAAVEAEIARDQATLYTDAAQDSPSRVPCPKADRVIVAVGQSNAANNAVAPQITAPSRVVNFYNGQCFVARDPLLGATGDRASVWTRVAQQLHGTTVLAPLAVGSSVMEEWAPGGRLHSRYALAVRQLRDAGYAPTDILVVEGESDGMANADPQKFESRATSFLRSLASPGARVVVAMTSRCVGYKPNAGLRAALERAITAAGAVLGPDLDTIPDSQRVNVCHFNQAGTIALATQWARLIN